MIANTRTARYPRGFFSPDHVSASDVAAAADRLAGMTGPIAAEPIESAADPDEISDDAGEELSAAAPDGEVVDTDSPEPIVATVAKAFRLSDGRLSVWIRANGDDQLFTVDAVVPSREGIEAAASEAHGAAVSIDQDSWAAAVADVGSPTICGSDDSSTVTIFPATGPLVAATSATPEPVAAADERMQA